MDSNHLSSVGILGGGRIGTGLGVLLSRAGVDVVLGSRHPASTGPGELRRVRMTEAMERPVVVLAIPHDAIAEHLEALHARLPSDAVLIDCANAVTVREGRVCSALDRPHGQWLAERLPGVRVARAFSHVQDELLVSRATRQPRTWAVGIAADDERSSDQTRRLVSAAGYVPVTVGTLAESSPLDPGGALFPNMFLPGDMRDLIQAD